jgi:hypothetical protein
LTAELVGGAGGAATVTVTTGGISRLDVLLDGRPRLTLDVTDGATVVEVPPDWGAWSSLELRGFEDGELVAMRRLGPAAPQV